MKFRVPDFDYAQDGAYFVTICTKQKTPFFGQVNNGIVYLFQIGRIARQLWLEIPERFANARLDEFVIMPDHMHGIIVLREDGAGARLTSDKPQAGRHTPDDATGTTPTNELTGRHLIYQMQPDNDSGVGPRLINQTPTNTPFRIKNNPMLAKGITLGRVVRWFNGRVTYEIHRLGRHDFAWQRHFYDHVIRNDADLNKIRRYIRQNPTRWIDGQDYPENVFSKD